MSEVKPMFIGSEMMDSIDRQMDAGEIIDGKTAAARAHIRRAECVVDESIMEGTLRELKRDREAEDELRRAIGSALQRISETDRASITSIGCQMLNKPALDVMYLAASYSRKAEIASVAKILRGHGIRVTSRWLDENQPDAKFDDAAACRDCATDDLVDICKGNTLVVFTSPAGSNLVSHAHLVEYGFALAFQQRLIVVGRLENVFMYLPAVEHYETTEQFLEAMTGDDDETKVLPRYGA